MLQTESLLRQYQILDVLGEGGFATTYLALDQDLQKKYAIKEYCPPEFAFREGATIRIKPGCADNFSWGKDRFLEEARVLARFNHSNIVGVNQIFEENDTAYMVLEYQSGRSLEAWLKEIQEIPSQEELDLILQPLLSALEAIHRNNVLHRDIAPDNLYIRDDGTPVLLDFGSAKEAVAARTKAVSAVVKDGYSPPEQYSSRGNSQGPWTDIYALAATLYYAISKKTPTGSTERLLEEDLPPLSELNLIGFRPLFLSAIDWGLRLTPKDRPQSIEAWRSMLLDDKDILFSDQELDKLNGASVAVEQAKFTKKFRFEPRHALIGILFVLFAVGNFWAYFNIKNETDRNIAAQMETRERVENIQRDNQALQQKNEQQRSRQSELEDSRRRQAAIDEAARNRQSELEEAKRRQLAAEETTRIRQLELEDARRRQLAAEEAARKMQYENEERRRAQETEEARRRQADAEDQRRRADNEAVRAALPRICGDALNGTYSDWDRSPQFSSALSTILQRGLSVENCRELMGLSRNPMSIKTGGWDLPGHDLSSFIENTNFTQCHNLCERNASCSAYTHNPKVRGGACQLKNVNSITLLTPAASPEIVSAYKKSAENYIRLINMEIKWNNDIVGTPFYNAQIDFEPCATYCSTNSSCNGFTWNEYTKTCQLYSFVSSLRRVPNSGNRAGIRQ